MKKQALCPECGRLMTWDEHMQAWDCGPEPRHGFWDPTEQTLEYSTHERLNKRSTEEVEGEGFWIEQ